MSDDGSLPGPYGDPGVSISPVAGELRTSFLEYAMSVIVARALPDVRDGLKPVQRRILWSMHRNRLRPDSPYRKSATVVGDVMARYHPHGDAAIYDTMVRLAQPFANAIPPVDGQGNFGTLDDPPAAARYTEARMAPAALLMTEELGEDTVDMRPNYDGKETEPSVLPARIPYLLVNGTTGIAVGLATRMAPHNLNEVTAALSYMLKHPDATVDDLMRFLPGPDLPTGGIIVDDEGGIREGYATGRGRFRIRASGEVTDVSARRKGVVFTELPYEVGPEKVVARVNQLLGEKKLPGVSKVVNLTDRKGTRLVVEFKTGFDPAHVLEDLYRLTPLEEFFSFNQIALVEGRPKLLGLVELCRLFLDHRYDVVRRRTSYRLAKAEARAHIVEGLIKALDAIDEVVAIIRASKAAGTARRKLMARFDLSEIQADHILDMQLRRLTSMELTTLRKELKELRGRIADLKAILASPGRQADIIAAELKDAAGQVGAARRTRIVQQVDSPAAPAPAEPAGPVTAALTVTGLISTRTSSVRPSPSDPVVSQVTVMSDGQVGLLLSDGQLTFARTADLPQARGRSRGGTVHDFFAIPQGTVPVALLDPAGQDPVCLVTRSGQVKRVAPADLQPRRNLSLVRLDEGDVLVAGFPAGDSSDLVLVTSAGQLLRTAAGPVRPKGRAAGPVAGIRLGEGDEVLSAAAIPADAGAEGVSAGKQDEVWQVVTVSDGGRVKITPASEYPSKGRGTGGVRCHRLLSGEQRLVAALVATSPVVVADGRPAPAEGLVGRRDGSGSPVDGAVTVLLPG